MTITVHLATLPALDAALVGRWARISSTITADLFEGRVLADPLIRPLRRLAPGPRLVGRALTVHCEPPDFGAVLQAVDLATRGDVLVIAAGGDARTAMIGDILSGSARLKGGAGVVCDGAVRDIAVLRSWPDFPVFSRSTTARGPASKDRGSVNAPVSFAGLTVSPGALVVGDDDGLVVLSPDEAAGSIDEAERRSGQQQRRAHAAEAERRRQDHHRHPAEALQLQQQQRHHDAHLDWVARLRAGETLCHVFDVPPAKVVDG